MANIFSKTLKWLGLKKDKKKAVDVPSPYETPQYQRYRERLEGMLAKRDVYSPEFMSEATSPYATRLKHEIKKYVEPEIASEASARGVGRSTIPVSMIGEAKLRGGMSIAEKMAQLALENEREKIRREEMALSELKGEALGRADVEARRIAAHEVAKEGTRATQLAGLKRFGTVAGAAIGSLFGPAGTAVGAQIGGSIFSDDIKSTTTDLLTSLIDYAKGKAGVAKIARPVIAGGRPIGATRLGAISNYYP